LKKVNLKNIFYLPKENKNDKIFIKFNHKTMARKCEICGKGKNIAWRLVKLRGKYNPTTKYAQKPNLQWFRLSNGKRILACTKCIKAKTKKENV
jgi:ribosomal protein L28